MNCAFLNCGETCSGDRSSETSPFACPYTGLAHGLHAMAQPLTVLRGALGARKMRTLTTAESDRYLEMSEKQVVRMGDLLGCLQDFLDTAEGKPKSGRLDLAELFGLVLEDMSSVLRDWGGKIAGVELDDVFQVQGDTDRTERALRAAMRAAISISSPGGLIQVSICSNGGKVELILENTATRNKSLGFAERLNLSIVESNIRGQGGEYKCVEDPFFVSIVLPAHRSEGKESLPELRLAEAHLLS